MRRKTGSMPCARLGLVGGLVLVAFGARAFDYAETLDGDIASYDENAPTPIGTLDPGVNTISGNFSWTVEGYDGDVFSVEAPAGTQIETIIVTISNHSGGFNAATRVFETPVFQSIDSHQFPADGSYEFMGPPLPPGHYGFTAVSPGGTLPPASYTWEWTIQVPEPAGALATLAASAALIAIASAHRDRNDRRLRSRTARVQAT